jgi:hypothetical protein
MLFNAMKQAIIDYNTTKEYTSADFISGGSTVSWAFGSSIAPFVMTSGTKSGFWYYMSEHTGIDRQGGQSIISPLFMKVVFVGTSKIEFEVFGSTRRITIMHLKESDISGYSIGDVVFPGSVICPFPDAVYGNAAAVNPLVHIQESENIDGVRVFLNPDNHLPNSDYAYEYGYSKLPASEYAAGEEVEYDVTAFPTTSAEP